MKLVPDAIILGPQNKINDVAKINNQATTLRKDPLVQYQEIQSQKSL